MWTWASVSQTFTFPYFLSNGGSCTYRTAILCGLMQGTQFLCNRLINSRIALVIQTTPTIVTSSVVSDTQYSDVQWSMKHLRNAKIIGLTWTKRILLIHITCSPFCLDTASRLSQSRSLGFLVWCGRTRHFRSLALRARSLALRARTIALRAQKLDLWASLYG